MNWTGQPTASPLAPGSERFRVPKVAVPVRLLLEGGTLEEGHLHVLPQTATGRERVADLLRASDPFLPLTSGDDVVLVHKERLVALVVGSAEEAGLPEAVPGEGRELTVELLLCGLPPRRARLSGVLHLDISREPMRLLDFLNEVGDYVPLVTTEGVCLVSRHYIVSVRRARPRPAPAPVHRRPARKAAARRRKR